MSIRMPSCQALRVGVRSGVSDPFRVDFAGIQEHTKEEAFASCGVYWSMLGHNHRNRDPAHFAISKNRGIGRLRYQTIEVRDSAWDTLLGIFCLGYSATRIAIQAGEPYLNRFCYDRYGRQSTETLLPETRLVERPASMCRAEVCRAEVWWGIAILLGQSRCVMKRRCVV